MEANNLFLQEHKKSGSALLADISHLFLLNGSALSLLRNSMSDKKCFVTCEEKELDTQDYLMWKEYSHIPVLINCTLQPVVARKTKLADKIDILAQLMDRLVKVSALTDEANSAIVNKNLGLIRSTINLIEYSVSSPTERGLQEALAHYLELNQPILDDNLINAVNDRKQTMEEAVRSWILRHSINLRTSRVIIIGTHGPRKNLLEQILFEDLYAEKEQEKIENEFVYYVEMLPTQFKQLDIQKDIIEGFLASSESNKQIGQSMLDSRQAMFEDIRFKYLSRANSQRVEVPEAKQKCPFALSS